MWFWSVLRELASGANVFIEPCAEAALASSTAVPIPNAFYVQVPAVVAATLTALLSEDNHKTPYIPAAERKEIKTPFKFDQFLYVSLRLLLKKLIKLEVPTAAINLLQVELERYYKET